LVWERKDQKGKKAASDHFLAGEKKKFDGCFQQGKTLKSGRRG